MHAKLTNHMSKIMSVKLTLDVLKQVNAGLFLEKKTFDRMVNKAEMDW